MARLDAGIAISNPYGLGLNVSGYYDGIGADDYEAYGGKARLIIPLNQAVRLERFRNSAFIGRI